MTTPPRDERVAELMPCPFCGAGETRIDEATHWTGMQSRVISVSVRHWCRRDEGELQSFIDIKRKTHDAAIAAWNHRALTTPADEGGSEAVAWVPRWPDGTFAWVEVTNDREELARGWGDPLGCEIVPLYLSPPDKGAAGLVGEIRELIAKWRDVMREGWNDKVKTAVDFGPDKKVRYTLLEDITQAEWSRRPIDAAAKRCADELDSLLARHAPHKEPHP